MFWNKKEEPQKETKNETVNILLTGGRQDTMCMSIPKEDARRRDQMLEYSTVEHFVPTDEIRDGAIVYKFVGSHEERGHRMSGVKRD